MYFVVYGSFVFHVFFHLLFYCGIFLQETYSIEDCLYYDSQTVNKSRYSITSGSASLTYSNNGLTVLGNQSTNTLVKNTALTLPSEYEAEITISDFTNTHGNENYGGICFDDCLIDLSTSSILIYKLSNTQNLKTEPHTLAIGDKFKIVRSNGTMSLYINDSLIGTYTLSSTTVYQHRTYNYRGLTIKDLKVKPL